MPEIKHTFTAGKMNKDVDERLVQNGEYRHALNVQVRTSDGDGASGLGHTGTVQNIKGNRSKMAIYKTESYIADTPNGDGTQFPENPVPPDETRIIGAIGDESKDRAFFFSAAPVPVGGIRGISNSKIKTASLSTTTGKWVDGQSERIWLDSIRELNSYTDPPNPYIFIDKFAITSVLEDAIVSFPASPSSGYVYITVRDATKYRIGMRVYAQNIPASDGTAPTNYLYLDEDQTIPGAEIVNISGNNLIFSAKQFGNLSTIKATEYDEDGDGVFTGQEEGGIDTRIPNGVIIFEHPERVLEFDYWKKDGPIVNMQRAYNIISNISVIDDLLFWSDGVHEPKKININRCRVGTYVRDDGGNLVDGYNGNPGTIHTQLYVNNPVTRNLEQVSIPEFLADGVTANPNYPGIEQLITSDIKREHITVIRKAPISPPTLHLSISDRINDSSGEIAYEFGASGQLQDGSTRVIVFPLEEGDYRLDDIFKFTNINNLYQGEGIVRGKIISIDGVNATIKILSFTDAVLEYDFGQWTFELEQRKPLFETKFGRFAYRYQYEDNEYSSFSPWSELAFLPGGFEYTPSKGYNKGMVNNVRSLIIKDFIPDNRIRPSDVKAVDILWKPTDDQNVYVVKSIKREIDTEWESFALLNTPGDSTGSMTITTEMIHKVLPSNQLLRGWDNVPRFAKAQEITANRIIYGNYIQGYDIDSAFGIKQSLESKKVLFPNPEKSVKSIRNYQFGAVFVDEYGRETSVISNGYKQTVGEVTETISGDLIVEKSLAGYSNKFKIEQSWDKDNSGPMEWMNYVKYFVKETSNEYYNLVMDRWYDAEDNNIWLSFPSADRNKVDEETYLILKNGHGSQTPVVEEARYKIIAIENNAPDYIKAVNKDYDMCKISVGEVYVSYGNDGKPDGLVGDSSDITSFEARQVLCSGSAKFPKGADFKGTPKARIVGYFVSDSESPDKKYYGFSPWKNISKIINNETDAEYGVVFREILEEIDVNMYQKILPKLAFPVDLSSEINNLQSNYSNATPTATIHYYLQLRDVVTENKPEFDGRFFVKVEKDETLNASVLGTKVNYEVQNSYKVAYIAPTHKWNPAKTLAESDDPDNFISGPYNLESDSDGDGVDENVWPSGSEFTANEVRFNYSYNDQLTLGETPDTDNFSVVTILDANTDATLWPDEDQYINPDIPTGTNDYGDGILVDEQEQGVPMFGPGDPVKTQLFWEWWKGNDDDTGLPRRSTNIFLDQAPAYRDFHKEFNFPEQGENRQVMQFLGSGPKPQSHYKEGAVHGPYPVGATYDEFNEDWEPYQNWQPSGLSIGSAMDGQYGQFTFSILTNNDDWNVSDEDSIAGQSDPLFKSLMMTPGTKFKFAKDPDQTVYVIKDFSQTSFDGYMDFTNPIEINSAKNHADSEAESTYSRKTIITRFNKVVDGVEIPNSGVDVSRWDPRGELQHNGMGFMEIDILIEISSGDLSDDSITTNSACWETEPKEDVGLDIYYEASEAIPIRLKNTRDLISFTKPSESDKRASKISVQDRIVEDDDGDLITEKIELPSNTFNYKVLGNYIKKELSTNVINIKYQAYADGYPYGTFNLTSDINRSGICLAINDIVSFIHHDGTVTRSKILDHYDAIDAPGDIDVPAKSTRVTRQGSIGNFQGLSGSFISGTGMQDSPMEVGMQVTGTGIPSGTFVVEIPNVSPLGAGNPGVVINRTLDDSTDINYTFIKVTGWFKIDTEVWQYPVDLGWFNCYSFGNGVESDRIRDDFNAPQIDNGVKASSTFLEYGKENISSGMIYSGLYNSTSSVNNLNEFNMAEKITKNLNPIYGSIQAMKTSEGSVTVFAEDKVIKVLANRDAIFNADGNAQLTATNRVLGAATPYAGDYGISKNPESLAWDQYRMYFSDKQRGAVLRLSGNGLTPISDVGMRTYFREKLKNADNVIGSFDVVNGEYNITISTAAKYTVGGTESGPETISFNEQGKGWVSFKSFIPSYGLSVSGKYYTTNNRNVYQHYDNQIRNNFYGVQYESEIEVMFGDSPDTIKSFKAINYEGSQSKITAYTGSTESYGAFVDGLTIDVNDNEYYNLADKTGWYVDSFKTDLQQGNVTEFIQKENKWFNKINGIEVNLEGIDWDPNYNNFGEFATQGIGFPITVSDVTPSEAKLTIKDSLDGFDPALGASPQIQGVDENGNIYYYFHGDDDL